MVKKKMTYDEMLKDALDIEKPYDLPEGWVWVKFGSVNYIEMGQSPSGEDTTDDSNETPLIGGAADMGALYPIIKRYTKRPTKLSQADDVIISVRATLGRPIISNGIYCLGRGVAGVRSEVVLRDFLRLFFLNVEDHLQQIGTGTTFKQISKSDISSLNFSLPPLVEQQRIVDRIETLFAKLDKAKELVQEALDSFEERRIAILHKAFTGELTTKWREKNGMSLDQKQIEIIRIQRLKEATPNKKKEIIKIYSYKEREKSPLPSGWQYICLDKICESFQYGTSSKSQPAGQVAVIRMGNLQDGKIDWANLVYTSDQTEIKKYKLYNGDVLFNRTNSAALVGKTSIYLGERPAIFAGYLIRIKNYDILNSHYLNYALNTVYARRFCERVKSDAVNQSNINAKKLAKFEIPFCNIDEQREIVKILDNYFEKEDKAQDSLQLIEDIDKMKKTILAKAFRGELGTGSPDDEPAIKLVQRIVREKYEESMKPQSFAPINNIIYEIRKIERLKFMGDLYKLLLEYKGNASPQELYKASGLSIDEFYNELKKHVNQGKICEVKEPDGTRKLVANYEN